MEETDEVASAESQKEGYWRFAVRKKVNLIMESRKTYYDRAVRLLFIVII